MHDQTQGNIFQIIEIFIFLNFINCILFISEIALTVFQMVNIRSMNRLQKHTKVRRCITAYGEGKCLKHILTYLYSTKCNKIIICPSDIQNHGYSKKRYTKYKYFLFRPIQNVTDLLRLTIGNV